MTTYYVTPTNQIGAGIVEIVFPPYRLAGSGLIEKITPTQNFYGGVVDKTKPSFSISGGISETCGVAVNAQAGVAEQLNVFFTLGGGVVEALAPLAALTDEFYSFVMNTKTGGFAEYTNFPLTSIFKVGTKFYGITGEGLQQLTGDNDNGAQIDAEMLSGISNLGDPNRVHPIDAWLELRGSGDIEFSTIMDEDWDDISEYVETCDNNLQIGFQRVELARGDDGTHIQIRFKNVNGSYFDLRSIRMPYEILSRISGGKR